MSGRSRIVRLLGLLAVVWLAGVPANLYAQAATPTPIPAQAGRRVIKEICRSLLGYDNLEALKSELEVRAKREAANELFGELIVASTTVENWIVTEDQIRSQSLGLVRIEGSPDFRNGANLGELCIVLTAYATTQDFARFQPQPVTKRTCVSGTDLTVPQARALAEESAWLQALIDYDRRLARYNPADISLLLRQVTYPESNVAADTDNYCATVQGAVIPIEIEGFLAPGGLVVVADATPTPAPSPTATATPCPDGSLRVGGACATVTPFPTSTRTPRPAATATPTACSHNAVRVMGVCATVTPSSTPTRTPRPTATATSTPCATGSMRVQGACATATPDMDTVLAAGQQAFETGDYTKAIADFTKVIGLDPEHANAYYERGRSYGYAAVANQPIGDYAKAIADLTKAIELDPHQAEFYFNRGIIYGTAAAMEQSVGDYAKAFADLSKAIEFDPTCSAYYGWRGAFYAGLANDQNPLGDYAKAIADLSKAIELAPTGADPYLASIADLYALRGDSYLGAADENQSVGDYAKAISDYSKAIEIDSSIGHYFYGRGLAYAAIGDDAQAQNDYRRAVDLGYTEASSMIK